MVRKRYLVNTKIKVLTIFGTRPEAVKLAPVVRKLKEEKDYFTSIVCVTAQHRQMLDQVLKLFKISPEYDLNIMRNNQTLFDITHNALMGLKHVLEEVKPDIILVQGDTTTTFVTSLACYYLKIPVGHVEAGLRTNEKYQPFPEEINRRLTSHLAELHFAPTKRARENLLNEGIDDRKIFVTGNTVIDALLMAVEAQSQSRVHEKLDTYFRKKFQLNLEKVKIILITGHRRENFGEGFEHICTALKQIAVRNRNIHLIYPVHLNPNVQAPVRKYLGGIENVYLIDPLDYAPFVYLMSKAYLILTDSGGIQEEAPSLGKPVLVMRNVTERPEGVEAGTSILVGTNVKKIVSATEKFISDKEYYRRVSKIHNPYGDGTAAGQIIEILKQQYHVFHD